VTIVVASYYGLFAVMGGFMRALTLESVAIGGFILDSVLGFRLTRWLVVAALFAHGVFDFFHGLLLANPGVPAWWPGFCLAYDITAAGYLGWLLRSGRRTANSPGIPPDSIR